jgi:hypothetical protein
MMMAVLTMYDATHANISHLPAMQQVAGYVTGTAGIMWTEQDFAAHPGAVRIDQSPANTAADESADVLDFENQAATAADLVPWVKAAKASFASAARPGQRSPAVYMSKDSVTEVVNVLTAGGVTACLWIADYSTSAGAAASAVEAASGPFPVIGYQYADEGLYDVSAVSQAWLEAVSEKQPPAPPGQWSSPATWTWEEAAITGTGLDGKLHSFVFTGDSWTRTS